MFLLAGCEQLDQRTPPLRTLEGLDQKPDVDACALVTQPEAQAVLGGPAVRDDAGTDPLVCSYSTNQSSPADPVKALRINVTGPYGSGIEFLLAAYGGAKGLAPGDEVQTVEGVGHHAVWVHGSSDALWALRGPVGVTISLASAGIADDAARLETATRLARAAVDRLPAAPDPDQSLAKSADPNADEASLSGDWKVVHTLTELSPGTERPEGLERDRTERTLWAPEPDCSSGPCDVNIKYFGPDTSARGLERFEYSDAGVYRRAQIFPGVASCVDPETKEVKFQDSHDRTVTTKFVVAKAGGNEALVLQGSQTWVDRPNAEFRAAAAADPSLSSGDCLTSTGGMHRMRAVRSGPGQSEHRPSFSSALHGPDDISIDPKLAGTNLLLAALLMLFITFPSFLFNATFEEHYDEIKGWFGFRRILRDKTPAVVTGRTRLLRGIGRWAGFLLIAAAAALLNGLLSPEFGPNRASAIGFLGILASILAGTIVGAVVSTIFIQMFHGKAGPYLKLLPGGLVVAAACVLISRAAHFLPGYLYGVIGGVAFRRRLDTKESGPVTVAATVFTVALSFAAWILWAPVKRMAEWPDVNAGILIMDAILASLFVGGVVSLIFGLIPMRILPGGNLAAWSRVVWAILYIFVLFTFVHVLLHPKSEFVNTSPPESFALAFILFGMFGLLSILFWAYFRFRKPSPSVVNGPET